MYIIILRTIVLKNKEKDLDFAALCDGNILPPQAYSSLPASSSVPVNYLIVRFFLQFDGA
jgi:hypothetical protein